MDHNVLTLYGNWEIDAYVRSNLFYLICLRHLIRSRAVALIREWYNMFFFSLRDFLSYVAHFFCMGSGRRAYKHTFFFMFLYLFLLPPWVSFVTWVWTVKSQYPSQSRSEAGLRIRLIWSNPDPYFGKSRIRLDSKSKLIFITIQVIIKY